MDIVDLINVFVPLRGMSLKTCINIKIKGECYYEIVFVPHKRSEVPTWLRGMSLKTNNFEADIKKAKEAECFRPLTGNEFKNKEITFLNEFYNKKNVFVPHKRSEVPTWLRGMSLKTF
uniref:hypothetical protein n=1 Tax=Brachyspira catarrhinii TaxID=2528966 RepID=UPI003F4BAA9A